ncbi:hypothetical protein [Burkholderia sp. Ac-20365]|uniref:hypothetical protein n=1 Tax=Burkholderia sp. Ac-20365 TaxID=2703897 RepID=UPI001F11FB95|nr:hypothetical protein [Burkholderia sp. Ac-20365]
MFNPGEVRQFIEAAGNLKYQTALSVAYGAGLHASEVVALKVTDVNSGRTGDRDRVLVNIQTDVPRAIVFRAGLPAGQPWPHGKS